MHTHKSYSGVLSLCPRQIVAIRNWIENNFHLRFQFDSYFFTLKWTRQELEPTIMQLVDTHQSSVEESWSS